MPSCDQASPHHVVQPSQGRAPDPTGGLKDTLQRIAGQIGDADRRHRDVLCDVHARLGQFGRQVGQVRSNLAGQHAGALDRLQQEIAGLTERIAAYGRQRHERKGAGGSTPLARPSGADQPWHEPWDLQSAEALTRICEMAEAEGATYKPRGRLAADRHASPTLSMPARAPAPACTYDRAWLEGRFASIAAQLQQSLADNDPAKPLATVDRRLDRLEGRLDTLFSDMSVRFSGEWLELIEAHIKGLTGHFEATSRQLARLDAVDEQLHKLSRAQVEHLQWSQAQPPAVREETISGLIDRAAERTANRLAAAMPAAPPPNDAETGKRIDVLEQVLQDYIAERRRGEEATSGLLHTIEERLIRVIDRIEAMEAGTPSAAARNIDPLGRDGMEAESDRLAKAYAAGARILGQHPPLPMLDAADYVPRPFHDETQKPAPAEARDGDGTTLQELRASVMRAMRKAQAEPEKPVTSGPPAEDDNSEIDKPRSLRLFTRLGGSRSNLLLGGALLLLFGVSYLAVDALIALHAAPTLSSSARKPAEAHPAADPAPLKAEPQPDQQVPKSEPVPSGTGDKAEPTRVPTPQLQPRPRETDSDDPAKVESPGLPPALP